MSEAPSDYLEAQPVSLRHSTVVAEAAQARKDHPEWKGSDRSVAARAFLESFRGQRFIEPTGVLCEWCQKRGRLACHCRVSPLAGRTYDPVIR